jgi:hypothetical protein
MHSRKYRHLVALLIALDEMEWRARELVEQFPDLRKVAEATSNAARVCDLAVEAEEAVEAEQIER